MLYVDSNNLHGSAMSAMLPISQLKYLSQADIDKFVVLKISDDSSTGYVLECDLE